MADLKISELTRLDSALVATADELPIVDTSASQTKKVTPDALVLAGIRLIPDASIPSAKVAGGAVDVADGSITTVKLANTAVTTAKVADGAITDAKITGPISLSKLGSQLANTVLAGPSSSGSAAPTFRALTAADLPKAGTTSLGLVSVPTTGGIVVNGSSAISLSMVATAGTSAVVTYGGDGRITAGRNLSPTDLPVATASTVGAVKPGAGLSVTADGTLNAAITPADLPVATATTLGIVVPGSGLTIDSGGVIRVNNVVAAGSAAKVSYNGQGLVTGAGTLNASDIPDLDAAKITSGSFSTAQIADRSVTQQKLADYAISYIQEASPGTVIGSHPVGELWFQESTAKLSMWNGNSWMPVGQGSLSDENMRFCGLFNAATGLVTALTPYGTTAGLAIGNTLPAATNQLTGIYLAIDTAGTYNSKTYDVGDWIICLGQARGYERLDLAATGSGGGGASKLSDLIDVTITTPGTGDVLTYNGTAWVNGGVPDPGTY